MSHFTTASVKVKADRMSAVKTALIAMGYANEKIRTSETPMPLTNYYGKHQGDAHVIVKGTGRAEIGIKFLADGQASITQDRMETGHKWEERFIQNYGKAVVKEVANEQQFAVIEESVDTNGEMVIVCESQW